MTFADFGSKLEKETGELTYMYGICAVLSEECDDILTVICFSHVCHTQILVNCCSATFVIPCVNFFVIFIMNCDYCITFFHSHSVR